MGTLNKKSAKLLIDYIVANDKYREKWEAYQGIKDIPHQLRMIEAHDAAEEIHEQLIEVMGGDEDVLNGLTFIRGIIDGLLGDYVDRYSN